jgi:hypothetical protein
MLSGEDLVEDNSERKQVAALIDFLSRDLLG